MTDTIKDELPKINDARYSKTSLLADDDFLTPLQDSLFTAMLELHPLCVLEHVQSGMYNYEQIYPNDNFTPTPVSKMLSELIDTARKEKMFVYKQ